MTRPSSHPPVFMCQKLSLLAVAFIAAGCVTQPRLHPIAEQVFPIPETHTLVLEFEEIDLELIGNANGDMVISGSSAEPDLVLDIHTIDSEAITSVSENLSGMSELSDTTLIVQVPTNIPVEIRIGSGSVYVHDLEGKLAIHTTSASILIERVYGHILAITRRGSIQISESQGEIDALAEADEIRFDKVRGVVTGTNIMGAIRFNGLIEAEDTIRLETDHGAVNVALQKATDAMIQLNSAGGRIVCSLAGMSGTFESCQGRFGKGAGSLWIRTVSGPIRIDPLD